MNKLLAMMCLCGAGVALAAGSSGVWLDVPFVKQEKSGCGAASIAMVMQYWQKAQASSIAAADPIGIQRELYSKEGHGIYASDLQHYFQEHGFRTFAFRGNWEDLRQHLEKGRPLIAALRPTRLSAELHYVVVAGIDWNGGTVLVNDPAERKLMKEDRTNFEHEWSSTNNWTLLALPQPTSP